MSTGNTGSPTPAWYTDPHNPAVERYWDGAWTDYTRPAARQPMAGTLSLQASRAASTHAAPSPDPKRSVRRLAWAGIGLALVTGLGFAAYQEHRQQEPDFLLPPSPAQSTSGAPRATISIADLPALTQLAPKGGPDPVLNPRHVSLPTSMAGGLVANLFRCAAAVHTERRPPSAPWAPDAPTRWRSPGPAPSRSPLLGAEVDHGGGDKSHSHVPRKF